MNNDYYVVINASNLHVGGGVQVAASFLTELSAIGSAKGFDYKIIVLCSNKVFANLSLEFDASIFHGFFVVDIFGLSRVPSNISSIIKNAKIIFTVFGPVYFRKSGATHICGFAQPWIAYPDNPTYERLSLKKRLLYKIKFNIQSFIFRRYDKLIVEQAHVKDALEHIGYDSEKITIVSNCVSDVFNNKNHWSEITFDKSILKEDYTFGFIGRPYAHKNVSILKEVDEILKTKYGISCNFLFTFTSSEMEDQNFTSLENFHTVGEININQCPSFYNHVDALLFTSLLECYSAAPIEAMKMKKSVLASDYEFVRDVCKDSAYYFDPLDAEDIARVIHFYISESSVRKEKIDLSTRVLGDLPSAKDRALGYLNIIDSEFKKI